MIEIDAEGVWRADGDELSLQPGRGLPGFDAVFPVLHGPFGEDGTVQGLLECLDVAYVGLGRAGVGAVHGQGDVQAPDGARGRPSGRLSKRSRPGTGALPRSRRSTAWPGSGCRCSSSPRASDRRSGSRESPMPASSAPRSIPRSNTTRWRLSRPMPPDSRSSVRCSATTSRSPLSPGRSCSPPGESGWYDYEAKYTPGGMQLVVPARIPAAVRERVRELAVSTFVKSACRGLARVDFFVVGDEVLVNELNTMPGFTATSVYASLFAASGIPYDRAAGPAGDVGARMARGRVGRPALDARAHPQRYSVTSSIASWEWPPRSVIHTR